MIFRAFFDESGIDPLQASRLVMGGFVGHFDEWERAAVAWDECLTESPSIRYFSHHEANTLSGEFRGFSRKEADDKSRKLAHVIAKFLLQGFCVTVEHSWFADRDSLAARGMMGSRVYDWGFVSATSGVLQYMSRLESDDYKIDFIFDRRNELRACRETYDEMKEMGLEHMAHAGECEPGDDKELAALQMADLLAGEFSYIIENNLPSHEPFQIIASARSVVHLPCSPPPFVPDTLALQKMGAEIRKKALEIQRRFYRDKERSMGMAKEVIDLKVRETFFFIELKRIQDAMGPGWEEYKEK